jgi:cobalt-zinc-cadmium efflux system outer membrane protein
MRKLLVPIVWIAGCLVGGAAAAQTADIPSRLSLADALRLAEARNPALEASRREVALAEADAASARRRINPAFSLRSEGYRGSSGGPSFLDRQELFFEVGQDVELGGKRRLRAQAADAATGRTRALVDDQVRQVRLDAQRAYYELALARFDADLAKASLDEVDQVIAINRSRYAQGEVSGGELRRLEVERLKFSDDVLKAELEIRDARAALLALVGSPKLDLPVEPTETLWPTATARAAAQAPLAAGAALDPAALTGEALAARPDVAAARKDEDRARAELGLQHALAVPNLTLTGGYRRDFGTSGAIFGVALPLPLFDRNAAGVARAEAEQRLAASQLEARKAAVSLDVQQAVNMVDISRERVAAIERDYLQAARAARDAALAAYKAGESQLLDYLDAQRAYREVQRSYGRALFDFRLSVCALDAARGVTPGGPRP